MAKDQPKIWCSMVMRTLSATRPVEYSNSGLSQEDRERDISITKKFLRGDKVNSEELPDTMKLSYYILPERKKKFPDMFFGGGGHLLITEKARRVFEEFNLGKTHIFPVTVHEYDGVTPRPEKYFILNVAEIKDGFVLDESEGPTTFIGEKWSIQPFGRPAIQSSSAKGVDLWLEDQVKEILFLSDPLAQALKKAKCSGLHLKTCVVVD